MCNSLDSVSFVAESTLRQMNEYAFGSCQALESITIPSSVEQIGRECFVWCVSLSVINFLPDSKLIRIEQGAFAECPSLRSLVIPGSVEHVGKHSFDGCEMLSEGFSFGSPSHIREFLDLPLFWKGLHDIPDSVENLCFDSRLDDVRGDPELSGLIFGRESGLISVQVRRREPFDVRTYFLQFTSRL
jgi:hypothetical protein